MPSAQNNVMKENAPCASPIRPRRLRGNPVLRAMARETRLSPKSLVQPVFVREGHGIVEPIAAMPGQNRYTPDTLLPYAESLLQAGVTSLLLFGIPDEKDEKGSGAWAEDGVVQTALGELKKRFPELYLIADVCLCEYTSHGHCGVLNGSTVDNDKTLPLLAAAALSHARAGADMVAPSDMMDHRVAAIRHVLDQNGFGHLPVMSYAVKYASSFYGPFREAAGSAPAFGDRKSYQMDWHNSKEALKEALLDVEEGADIVMVKPALSYLDIVANVASAVPVPTAAYSVSGEYAMLKAAAAAGYINEYAAICESAVSIFRAGANILCTYFAPELAAAIRKGDIG